MLCQLAGLWDWRFQASPQCYANSHMRGFRGWTPRTPGKAKNLPNIQEHLWKGENAVHGISAVSAQTSSDEKSSSSTNPNRQSREICIDILNLFFSPPETLALQVFITNAERSFVWPPTVKDFGSKHMSRLSFQHISLQHFIYSMWSQTNKRRWPL